MQVDEEDLRSVPIWIQFPGLPWEFWSTDSLSLIGSICGKPFYCDQCTITKSMLSYDRIQVEMDVFGDFLDFVTLKDESGAQFKQPIIYKWRPLYCETCKKLVMVNKIADLKLCVAT